MSNSPDTSPLHEEGWEAHEASGHQWEDPTNDQKIRLALSSLKELGHPGSVRLLDYGCGNGVLTQMFHVAGYDVQGVDFSKTAISGNQSRLPHLKFQVSTPDGRAPYEDGSFDAIFCSEVIEHVYDTRVLFAEFQRLLRPNGQLLLTTPYHGLVKNVIVALFFFERHFDPTWQHIRFYTKRSLSLICRSHDLNPISWKHVGRYWPVPKSFFVVCKKNGPA